MLIPIDIWPNFIHGTMWVIISFLLIIIFRKQVNKAYLAIALATGSFGAHSLLLFFGGLLENDLYTRFAALFISLTAFFGILFVDLVTNEKLRNWTTSLSLCMILSTLFFMMRPDSVIFSEFNSFSIPIWSGVLKYTMIFQEIIFLGFAFWYFYSSWQRAQKLMPKTSHMILIGTLIGGPMTMIGFMVGSGQFGIFFSTMGYLILAFVGFSNPKLLYLLSFNATRLIIIDDQSGVPLFEYSWIYEKFDSCVIGGLLKGIIEISKMVMQKGYIRELRLDNGYLLIYKKNSILVGVFTTRSSNYLEDCIKRFTNEFLKIPTPLDVSNGINLEKITFWGQQLIEKNFSFIAPRKED